jgi:hypothetical protein
MCILEQIWYSKFSQILLLKMIWKNGMLFKMNFKSLFQNLVGILNCTFKQSCRESNSKQLLFWGQDVKMPFSSSNLKLGAVL